MPVEFYLYLTVMGLAVISGFILLSKLRKFSSRLPKNWQSSSSLKNFRWGVFLLSIHVLIDLITEFICFYLAKHGIYNHFVISINFSLSTPFLFSFFLIYTKASWKRYAITVLYGIMITCFIVGGYYHPDAVLPNTVPAFLDSIIFLAALLHLTDLLEHPQSEQFRFQLKINLSILIFSILSTLLTSVYWIDTPGSATITILCFANQILLPLAFTCIFIIEMFKLRRR